MKRSSILRLDLIVLLPTILLLIIGVIFIYSSGITSTGEIYSFEYIKQIIWVGLGVIILFLVCFSNYSAIRTYSPYIYGISIILLFITLIFGKAIHKARSWLAIGDIIGIQPSEFAKISTILFLGWYLHRVGDRIKELPRFLIAFGICLLPILFILVQPDMGTALVYFPIFFIMLYIAGAKKHHIFFIFLIGFLAVILALIPIIEEKIIKSGYPIFSFFEDINFGFLLILFTILVLIISIFGYYRYKKKYFYWIAYSATIIIIVVLFSFLLRLFLKDYQKDRLIIFIDPWLDDEGAGWNIIQSIRAVGSGGFWGKGLFMGTQSHYYYLPQQSTDFIFSILAEEWGFLGGIFVLTLFLTILLRSIKIIYDTNEIYGQLIGSGIIVMIFFHVFINIGMAIGIMPITGIPLFFLSYGGSSLLTALIGIGIILNIYYKQSL